VGEERDEEREHDAEHVAIHPELEHPSQRIGRRPSREA
jgi:hypothetical protein